MTELTDFKVGDRTVRPSLGLIVKGDESVRVEPRSIDVLVALAKRGRTVYPKKELIEAVWGDTFVSDEVLTHAIWDLRKAFGDNASDPSYIQTIPKRGYRMIAPVQALGPRDGSRHKPALGSNSRLPWAALAVALLFMTVVALTAPGDPTPPPVPEDPAELTDRVTLGVASSRSTLHDTERSERLAEDLRSELVGKPGIAPERADSCDAGADGGYCLVVRVAELAASYEARIELHLDGRSVWSPPVQPVTATRDDYESLAEQVAAYFEVIRMPYYDDPDSRPWFDLSRHDTRAVRAFLKGMEQVYENEVGGRVQLDAAIEIDPDFIAPRIIRIPTLVAEGLAERVTEHLEHLSTLKARAKPFEAAMIDFARAHSEGALQEEIRFLRAALRSAEEHRPTTYLLASRLLADDQVDKACARLAHMIDGGWEYPPLYTDTVSCRILLGQVDDARSTADAALALEYVDPELLLMRTLLAIDDEQPETEREFRRRFDKRVGQIAPEVFDFDASALVEKLAEMAEEAGRGRVAKRLREFSY